MITAGDIVEMGLFGKILAALEVSLWWAKSELHCLCQSGLMCFRKPAITFTSWLWCQRDNLPFGRRQITILGDQVTFYSRLLDGRPFGKTLCADDNELHVSYPMVVHVNHRSDHVQKIIFVFPFFLHYFAIFK